MMPWLLLPLSLITGCRLFSCPSDRSGLLGIALWYSIAVLYSQVRPMKLIYQALWNILSLRTGYRSWTVVHLTIKPQDPLKQLKVSIAEQLAAVETILSARLADSGVKIHDRVIPNFPAPAASVNIWFAGECRTDTSLHANSMNLSCPCCWKSMDCGRR